MSHKISRLPFLTLVVGCLTTHFGFCGVPNGTQPAWARGIEGQRKADLGNGSFVNPILAGDRPDPSVLKHGSDYYMVHSSFASVPGLLIWHSRDLVNWEPVGPALTRHVGIVWAPDLTFHHGRFSIYLPVLTDKGFTNMVVTATDSRGPWSDPVDLHLGLFDPGHTVGSDIMARSKRHPRAIGKFAVQPDCPHADRSREVVVQGPCNSGRRTGWQAVVSRPPRLQKRLPQPWPSNAPRTRGVDCGRLAQGGEDLRGVAGAERFA